MNKQNYGIYMIIVTVIIAVTILGAAILSNPNFFTEEEKRTVTMDGSFSQSVAPDMVEVVFSVVTRADNATETQRLNTEISNRIIVALKDEGYTEEDIETVYYNVNPVYDWTVGYREIVGYEGRHQMKVNNTDITVAGNIVDIAMQNGANEINYIDFTLKRETEEIPSCR